MTETKLEHTVTNIVQAKNIVGAILRNRGFEIDGGHGAHKREGMYSHYFYTDQKTRRKYWIKFDKENFQTFGREFREYANTVGETVDAEVIDGLNDNDILIIVKPTNIYYITVKTIRDTCRDRLNEADNNTKTYSFDVKLLEPFI